MKKTIFFTFSLLALLSMAACTQAPDSDKAGTTDAQAVTDSITGETWQVDPSASLVEWIGTKVTGYHSGAVQIKNGALQVQNGNITGGKFVLDLAGLTVTGPAGSDKGGNDKLLEHLKSPDFFDVANYPEATFEITEVATFSGTQTADPDDPRQADISKYKVANPTHTISGNLTIKNVTKNIQFPARIEAMDNSVTATAKFNIDRMQWDVKYAGKPDDLIRNEIHLGIALKAAK